MKHYIKVTFKNGDFIHTWINGTKESIYKYYMNNTFNLGPVKDNLQKVENIIFLDS